MRPRPFFSRLRRGASLKTPVWLIVPALILVGSLHHVPAAEANAERSARIVVPSAGATLPADFTDPEGRTRWDLTGVSGETRTRTTGGGASDAWIGESADCGALPAARVEDPAGRDAALRWVAPDRVEDMLRTGTRSAFEL